MFDPTAFDNMKVVIEGALYDKDIGGEIVITDRNDVINMAKMSRQFDVSFQLPNRPVMAKFEMESRLANLAAELLPFGLQEQHAGCFVGLEFSLERVQEIDYQTIKGVLQDTWGTDRKISFSVIQHPLEMKKTKSIIMKVEFDRLITEDQLDDLDEMVNFMKISLEQLYLHIFVQME
ncbi:hypothetical protein J1P26_00740 [Neobacillus sp. MM2021_6]|uniref:hypothetical protein n=1 Tax=Bacillaceae TaxID=186817 RepID=UPI00140A810C|nr:MULTISPECIES: hypothetical protein [Bacillaceae]MBO0958243.1 hypothetical protein [Neobacillus sp. MM2021_6]NHC17843.1 hypothetical protein [Bacillus sp. MM2020_4]